MEQGFVLFVELFPSTGVLWVIGVRLHISILLEIWVIIKKINHIFTPYDEFQIYAS